MNAKTFLTWLAGIVAAVIAGLALRASAIPVRLALVERIGQEGASKDVEQDRRISSLEDADKRHSQDYAVIADFVRRHGK